MIYGNNKQLNLHNAISIKVNSEKKKGNLQEKKSDAQELCKYRKSFGSHLESLLKLITIPDKSEARKYV